MIDAPLSRRPNLTTLITGLLGDIRSLIVQEVRLARHEIQMEAGELTSAMVWFGAAAGIALMGAVTVLLTVAHVLHEVAGLPLWASYGLVALVVLGLSAVFAYKGKRQLAAVNALPKRTMQSIKEDAQWLKEQVASPRT